MAGKSSSPSICFRPPGEAAAIAAAGGRPVYARGGPQVAPLGGPASPGTGGLSTQLRPARGAPEQ
eukprot:8453241-Heterocapsa_arctica.AAC.1